MTDQEFEKEQPGMGTINEPEGAEQAVTSEAGAASEASTSEAGTASETPTPEAGTASENSAQQPSAVSMAASENNHTGDYRKYNYQQEQSYDYGNTGYHANYSQNQKPGEEEMDTRPLSMGEWALTLLAMLIPCCGGIILYIFWAFSKKGNVNRRNYCRAALIVMAGVAVVYFLVMSILGGAIFSYVQHYGMY